LRERERGGGGREQEEGEGRRRASAPKRAMKIERSRTRRKSFNGYRFAMPHLSRRGDKRIKELTVAHLSIGQHGWGTDVQTFGMNFHMR
jgi:hypothetical protein